MDKILSVIVPAYNMEKYLDRCLSSLILDHDRMKLLEVIVVNDGSTDKSSYIAHGYQHSYQQTYVVIDKDNGNYGSCINAALKVATGMYIKILDADDFFDTAGLSTLIDALVRDEGQSDMVMTNVRYVDESGCKCGDLSYNVSAGRIFTIENIDDDTVKKLHMHSLTYKLSVLEKLNYHQTEGISYTDLEWTYYPVAAVDYVMYINSVVYVYNTSREGQTTSVAKHCRDMWMETGIIERMLENYCYSNCYDNTAQHIYMSQKLYYYVEQIYNYYLLSYPRYLSQKDLREFDKSVRNCPDIYSLIKNTRTYIHRLGNVDYVAKWQERQSRWSFFFLFHDLQESASRLYHKMF